MKIHITELDNYLTKLGVPHYRAQVLTFVTSNQKELQELTKNVNDLTTQMLRAAWYKKYDIQVNVSENDAMDQETERPDSFTGAVICSLGYKWNDCGCSGLGVGKFRKEIDVWQ